MSANARNLRIYEVLLPLSITSRLFALPPASSLNIENRRNRLLANIVEIGYAVGILVLYGIFINYNKDDGHEEGFSGNSFVSQLAYWTQKYFTAINVYILAFCNLLHRNRMSKLAIEFNKIDRVLLRLGIYIQYRESLMRCLWGTLAMIAAIVLSGLCSTFSLKSFSINYLIYIYIPMFIYACVIIQFSMYLYLARQRYKILNDLLETHCLKSKRPVNSYIATKNKVFTEEINPKMKQFDVSVILDMIFELHDELFEICKNINFSYGFQILVSLMISFITILSEIYAFIGDKNTFLPARIMAVTEAICHTGAVLTLVVSASQTTSEATQTKLILHRARNANPELKETTEMYSLQLLHQQVNFSACGFFALDFTLLYSIVGALTTYLVILIQFEMGSTPGSGQNGTNETTTELILLSSPN